MTRQSAVLFAFLLAISVSLPIRGSAQDLLVLCSPSITPSDWTATNIESIYTGDVPYGERYFVAPGLARGCASQLRSNLQQVCIGTDCSIVTASLVPFPLSEANPNTFDAKDGDGMPLTISIGAPGISFLSGCFPGQASSPGLCPAELFADDFNNAGVMAYRLRSGDGTFSGPWIVSAGTTNPGFSIRKVGTCSASAPSCPYEIVFRRTSNGTPAVTSDAQVVLILPMTLPPGVTELGTRYNSSMAVPLFVKQSARLSSSCVVPQLIGLTKSAAKVELEKVACKLGTVTSKNSAKFKKGLIISTSPKANTKRAIGFKVAVVLSLGKPR